MQNDTKARLAPDINDLNPKNKIKINKAGVCKLRQQILIRMNGLLLTIPAEFKLTVELPSNYRAAHMSRNLEALKEVSWELDENGIDKLRPLDINMVTQLVAKQMLLHHNYSGRVFVEMKIDYFSPKYSPERKHKSYEHYEVELGTTMSRDGDEFKISNSVVVSVEGTTTCPCAQNQSKFITLQILEKKNITLANEVLDELIFPTHMQRAVVKVSMLDYQGVTIEDIITIAESSMSNNTHGFLKRDDEESLIRDAFLNPKFVEDVVRNVVFEIQKYKEIKDETLVNVEVETQESIHKHNAFAEIRCSIGDLRELHFGRQGVS